MDLDFTLLFFIRILSGLFALALIAVLWKRRNADGVIFMILFEFAAAIWTISEGLEHATTSIEIKLFWSQVGYIGTTTSPVFFLFFSLAYTQLNKYIKPSVIGLFLIIPAITILLIFTNFHYHLIWADIDYLPASNEIIYKYGDWFWIYALYEYVILLSAIIILQVAIIRFYKVYKAQLVYLILASVLPLITSIMYVFKMLPVKADLTPIVLVFSGILAAFGIYFRKMFDVGPVARRQTIDNLSDGVIVVDLVDRIVDVNRAFCRIINASREELIENQFKRFSNLFLGEGSDQLPDREFLTETNIRTDNGLRYFEVKYSPVTDNRQKLVGRIFLLHDISIRKKALDAAFESNALLRNEIKEKETLIADLDAYARSVAHDLKNPISGVIGLVEFIKEDIQNQNYWIRLLNCLDLLN